MFAVPSAPQLPPAKAQLALEMDLPSMASCPFKTRVLPAKGWEVRSNWLSGVTAPERVIPVAGLTHEVPTRCATALTAFVAPDAKPTFKARVDPWDEDPVKAQLPLGVVPSCE